MAVINHAKREINAKIVYFGPPDCGKGELFRFIHQRIKPSLCGALKSMPAGQDTLLFFDYTPFEISSLDGYRIRFHLYTLSGTVANPGTWKMTLKGVDGLAFVTGEGEAGGDNAVENLRVLRSMLSGYGRELQSLPRLWLPCGGVDSVALDAVELKNNFDESRTVACSPCTGAGVLQSLAQLTQEVLQRLRKEYEPVAEPASLLSVRAHDDCDHLTGSVVSSETVTLPELNISLAGDSIVRIPIAIQNGSTVRRCNLRLSLQLEEDLT